MSDLKNKTLHGFMWKTIQSLATTGLSFFFMIFMTRLLTPEDYGLIGMISVFIVLSEAFINCGFGQALIRKQDRTRVDESTVFYFNIAASTLCYLILYLAAPYIASFYEMPILCNVLRLQGIALIISSFSAIQVLICSINIDFKTPTYVGLIASSVSGVTGIVIAYLGYGVWALVWQQIILAFVTTITYYFMSPWRPQWAFSYKTFKEMFSFGSKLLGAKLLNIFYSKLAPIVIGKKYSAAELGLFSKAEQLASFPCNILMGVVSSVSYPVLCKLQNDKTSLSAAYSRMIRTTSYLLFPFMIFLSFYGKQVMVFLFGIQWAEAGKYLAILCLPSMTVPIQCYNLNLLQVVGRSDLLLKLEIISKAIGFTILMVTLPINVMAICIGYTITTYMCFFINTYYTSKFIDYPLFRQIRDVFKPLILSIIVVGVSLLSTLFISNITLQLLMGFVVAALLYLLLSYLLKLQELSFVVDLIKEKLPKRH